VLAPAPTMMFKNGSRRRRVSHLLPEKTVE